MSCIRDAFYLKFHVGVLCEADLKPSASFIILHVSYVAINVGVERQYGCLTNTP